MEFPDQDPLIDGFVDALWLEDGLAKNTLAAYRRDLQSVCRLAGVTGMRSLLQATQDHINGLLRHSGTFETKATTANRRLTVLRRFFHWALARTLDQRTDPTLRMLAAKQAHAHAQRP
jgi:integrase/recombinase XerD